MYKPEKNLSKVQREQRWEQILKEWLASGKTAFAYCKENKVPVSCFYQWRNRLLPDYPKRNKSQRVRNKRLPKSPFFVPVEVRSDNEHAKASTFKGLTLHYPNGCYLHLKDDFDPRMLGKLNQAMGV